jgi:imidazoleglycerol-phosphate dehydratase/histidinol-phosphatase
MFKKLFIFSMDCLMTDGPGNRSGNTNNLLPGSLLTLYRIRRELGYLLVGWLSGNSEEKGSTDISTQSKDLMQRLTVEGINLDDTISGSTQDLELTLLRKYSRPEYDLENSIVLFSRSTELNTLKEPGSQLLFRGTTFSDPGIPAVENWIDMFTKVQEKGRSARTHRKTGETDIRVNLQLDGSGESEISTGLGFFDHMLEQLGRHGGINLSVDASGDLQVDEHHLIEDTAIALGQAFRKALGDKSGIERYGYVIPMDDALAQVAIDFSGRSWLVWETSFKREKIGEVPIEMFQHFFKSFSDNAGCTLNIRAEGQNEHHKIEAIFKAWARAIKMAINRTGSPAQIPSTKGVL